VHVGKVHQLLAMPAGREVLDADGEIHNARVVGVRDTVGRVQDRQSDRGQPEPHGVGPLAQDPGGTPSGPCNPERRKQRQSDTEPKG